MIQNPIDSKLAGQRNEKLILNILKKHGPCSQVQLCELTGLGSSTTCYIVSRLREKSLIIEQLGKSKRPGAKPVLISINPLGKFVIGAEISPSNLLIVLFDFNQNPIDKITAPLVNHNANNVIELLEINLKGLISRNSIDQQKIIGIGITLSGSVSADGVVVLSSPLGWKNVELKKILSARFDCPVEILTTKVRLLAEINSQPKQPETNIVYLNVANGVGSTIMIDGKLIAGATNQCGELGHIIVEPNGPICGCGNRGCLEAIISGPAIAKKIKNDIAGETKTLLSSQINEYDSPEKIVSKWGKAVNSKDEYSLSIRDFISDHLSKIASVAINCYDPDVLTIAGYVLEQCPQYFLNAIKQKITTNVYDQLSRNIQIRFAKAGKNALVTGAMIAIMQKYLKN